MHVLVVISLFGAGISGLVSTDSQWMSWHFSRLGEGSTLSATIFNTTLLISAILTFITALTLKESLLSPTRSSRRDVHTVKNRAFMALSAITVCLIGLSFFPFDRFPVVHNIFGYLMALIFVTLFLTVPRTFNSVSRQFYRYSYFIALAIALIYLFVFQALHVITLLEVEIISYLLMYGWLLMLTKEIEIRSSK